MKTLFIAQTIFTVAIGGLIAAGPAQAKGCIKGAVVGGLAGHAVHHGVLGAAGGCAVGHHIASKQARQSEQQQMDNGRQRNTAE